MRGWQICVLQCLFYVTLGFLQWLVLGFPQRGVALHNMLDPKAFDVANPSRWLIIASFFLNALACAAYMSMVVERAKKCLDFASTMYIVHFLIVLGYAGWPASLPWWTSHLLCLILTAVLAEALCLRQEMREVQLSNLIK